MSFAAEIGFKRVVIVKMITRQVGEPASHDPHTVEPMLSRDHATTLRVRDVVALAGKTIERACGVDRIRRHRRAVFLAFRRHHADRADAGGRMAERSKQLSRECRNRGLAAGARNRCNRTRLARIKFCRDKRERAADIVDLDQRYAIRHVDPDVQT